ncbi:unnamed protein product, partial [Cuscuta europaea]
MAPKKSKTSSSRAIPPVAGYESVEFATEAHKTLFKEQAKRE